MELSNVYKTTKIVEAIENYSNTDDLKFKQGVTSANDDELFFYDAETFWVTILDNPQLFWNTRFSFNWFVLSSWLPRIPGLCWTQASKKLQDLAFNEIAYFDGRRIELLPTGKSKMVVGGLGTIKLPPSTDGRSLWSICSFRNSAEGIPVLIFPEVLEYLKLKEGYIIKLSNCIWQAMSIEWSQRFASTSGIPRGFLVVNNIDQIEVIPDKVPIISYPYSIMEYQKEDALLYDFVYLSVDDINQPSLRSQVESFFKDYANKESRHGKYLINPNCMDPYFDAQYNNPLEMRHPSEKSKIDLLYKRIRNVGFKRTTLDKLIEVLPHYYDSSVAIKRLAKNVGISQAIFHEDNAASMSAQLINYCTDENKIEELTDRMIVEYPQIFNS